MQSPQTPGVYYERVDASAPAITLLRTDIAAFVGIATRGPLHQPLPVQSWRQFQAYFGDFTGAGYLAYAARAFFENGGQRSWIVRVASETAASAALTLQSESFTDVWTISASSPGVWGNDLDIVIRETHRAQTLAVAQPSAPEFSTVLSTAGFGRATHVRPITLLAGYGKRQMYQDARTSAPSLTSCGLRHMELLEAAFAWANIELPASETYITARQSPRLSKTRATMPQGNRLS